MNKFERNNTDEFTIESLDLGKLTMLRVWHDDSGPSSGWFLDRIEVIETSSQSRYVFVCGRWLASDEDDRTCIRELLCNTVC